MLTLPDSILFMNCHANFVLCFACIVSTQKHRSVKRQHTNAEARRQVIQVDYAAENLIDDVRHRIVTNSNPGPAHTQDGQFVSF